MDKQFHPTLYNECNHLSMVGLKSIYVSKRGPEASFTDIHYDDVIMSEIASQITSLTIVYSTVLSGADQSKHQSSASLAFVWEIHRWPVNFPHKWPVTRKIFPFDDVIMSLAEMWTWMLNYIPWDIFTYSGLVSWSGGFGNSFRPSDAKLGHHWFRYWLVACWAQNHYLDQRWFVVNWTIGEYISVKFK